MKLKAAHILVDIEDQREKKSIASMSILKPEIEYIQCINERYKGDAWKNMKPIDGWKRHGEGHYGAFQSFKKAILENFTDDIDALLLFECDCVLNVSKDIFLENVYNAISFCSKYNLPYFSFGPRVTNGYLQSNSLLEDPDFADFIVTDKIIQAHCILLTKNYKNYIFSKLNNSWDSPDIWFNAVFKNFKMGIVKNELAYQTLGVSMIDNCIKGEFRP
jgi:hypothetical protein